MSTEPSHCSLLLRTRSRQPYRKYALSSQSSMPISTGTASSAFGMTLQVSGFATLNGFSTNRGLAVYPTHGGDSNRRGTTFLMTMPEPMPTPVEAHAVTGRLRCGAATTTWTGRIESCPGIGHRILADVLHLAQAAEIVLRHEECLDGSGYPRGLAGDDIPCRQGRGLAHVQHPIRSCRSSLD